jgi:phosphate transport system ATP-binding protein
VATPQQQLLRVPVIAPREGNEVQKTQPTPKLNTKDLNFFYGSFQALHDITIGIPGNKITAFIGPSGCGKSTFLRTMNRMNEALRNTKVEGTLLLDGESLLSMDVSKIQSVSEDHF